MSDTPLRPEEQPSTPPVEQNQPTSPPASSSLPGEVSDQELEAALGALTAEDIEKMTQQGGDAPAPSEGGLKTGRVIRVTAEEVFVDLDGKTQGSIPIIEFTAQPIPKEGEEIKVIIERFDPATGMLVLSKRQADELTFWQSVQPGDVLEGVVTGMNKGGLDVDIGGARAFLPASQVDIRRIKDISVLIGEHVKCTVTQVDRTTRDLVVSRRTYLEKERQEKRHELLDQLQEGEMRVGTVTNLTDFGAFVDIGGIEGLIHISDMSWSRIRHPSEVVQPGQEVRVQILKINHETGKLSLGLKQVKPNPWDGVEERYSVGSRVRGRVLRLADFGAFVELEEGVEALLPISELSWGRRIGHPSEVVREGDVIELVVLKVEAAKKKISVSLKQVEANPWSTVESRFPVNSTVRGKVTRIMEYGAFVELAPGVEALIHISELSDKRVRSVSDVLKEGQEIEARVIKLDLENQRISLSTKPAQEATSAPAADTGKPGKQPTRKKKPLRGGLSSHFDW